MKTVRLIAAAMLSTLSIAACSPAQSGAGLETKLKQATAEAVPGVSTDDVVISSQSSTPAAVRWRAAARGKTYDCDADNMVRLPDCRQVS